MEGEGDVVAAADGLAKEQDNSVVEQDGADAEESGEEEPSGESLQGDGAGVDDDDDYDDSAGSLDEFIVGDDFEDEEDEEGEEENAAADGDEDAPDPKILDLLMRKKKRRRKRFDAEIQEEAEELLATGGTKHRVRVGDEAVHGDGKKVKASERKASAASESDDDDDVIGGADKRLKPAKGGSSMDMKDKKEEDEENQREYNLAFDVEYVDQDVEEEPLEATRAVARVVDPMEEFECYQTSEDKIAIIADIPERIFDALPPGKMTLKDMTKWQRIVAPRVVAHELKAISFDLRSSNADSTRHLGFEHIIVKDADPEAVFDAAVAVATHVGVHLREPPFIRLYLSSCYANVLHHEALWYIFDRVMDATLLVKNAAECLNLMQTFFDHDDKLLQEAEMIFKDAPQILTEMVVFDYRNYVHTMKYNEGLAAGAVSSLSASDPNFHAGTHKPEVVSFLSSFTLPARLIMPCMVGNEMHTVETPAGRFLDLLEPLKSLLVKRDSEQTERVVVSMASKIISADIHFRQHVRSLLKKFVRMTITVTREGFNQYREFFCLGEHFKNQKLDVRQCEHQAAADTWQKAPAQPIALYHNNTMSIQDSMPDHLAQWFRFEKKGYVKLDFKCVADPHDPTCKGGCVLRELKSAVNKVYLDPNYDVQHDFNVVRGKILHEVFHKHLIPLIVREQREYAQTRTKKNIELNLYRSFRDKLAFPPLRTRKGQKDSLMTVCHSRAGCDPHFVISTVDDQGFCLVLHHFSHQKSRLGADAMAKFGVSSESTVLCRDLELKHKLDQIMERYDNIYAIVVGCHNAQTRELFRFLDAYMRLERRMGDCVYYFDEQVSQLVADGEKHARGEAYLVAESLARFATNPVREATKLFAARELPLIFKLIVHPEQSMISNARRRDIAARVIVDSRATRLVSHEIFSVQPEQARLLLQFVPGLGPRKARIMSDKSCGNWKGLQTREDLKNHHDPHPIIGDVIFLNCAGFLAG